MPVCRKKTVSRILTDLTYGFFSCHRQISARLAVPRYVWHQSGPHRHVILCRLARRARLGGRCRSLVGISGSPSVTRRCLFPVVPRVVPAGPWRAESVSPEWSLSVRPPGVSTVGRRLRAVRACVIGSGGRSRCGPDGVQVLVGRCDQIYLFKSYIGYETANIKAYCTTKCCFAMG